MLDGRRARGVGRSNARRCAEIQQMLAPTKIDTAPGLKVDVAFYPTRCGWVSISAVP